MGIIMKQEPGPTHQYQARRWLQSSEYLYELIFQGDKDSLSYKRELQVMVLVRSMTDWSHTTVRESAGAQGEMIIAGV